MIATKVFYEPLRRRGPGEGDGVGGHDDFGRMRVTGGARPLSFRTTPLRNVEFTAPYGHDGAIMKLRDFVGTTASPTRNFTRSTHANSSRVFAERSFPIPPRSSRSATRY